MVGQLIVGVAHEAVLRALFLATAPVYPSLGRVRLALLVVLSVVAVVLLMSTAAALLIGRYERWATGGGLRANRKLLRGYVNEIRNAQPLRVVDNPEIGWEIQSPDGYNFFPIGAAGPRVFSASTSKGFEQSPEGAALAAIHILHRSAVSNQQWESVLESQVTGDGVPAVRESTRALLGTGEQMLLDEVGAHRSAYVGWTVVGYNPLGARINLAGITAVENSAVKWRMAVTLTWVDGDWKLVLGDKNSDNEPKAFEVDEFRRLDVDFLAAFALDGSD